jgi:AcrR family transcriptional regulator
VEAASQLFQEFGFEGASMNELAARLQGSKATLSRYFPSKEALFGAVVRCSATSHLSEAVEEMLREPEVPRPIADVLVGFGERMLMVLANDTCALAVYRMVIAEAGRSPVGELFYEAGFRDRLSAVSAEPAAAVDAADHCNGRALGRHVPGWRRAALTVRAASLRPSPSRLPASVRRG